MLLQLQNRDTIEVQEIHFDGFTSGAIENSSGYSITKTNSSKYTFDVSSSGSSETASTGDISGGGGTASAGPVTVSA